MSLSLRLPRCKNYELKKYHYLAIEHLNSDSTKRNLATTYILKIRRETKDFFYTEEVPILGLRGDTEKLRLRKEMRWSKQTLRPYPLCGGYWYYQIFQILDFEREVPDALK